MKWNPKNTDTFGVNKQNTYHDSLREQDRKGLVNIKLSDSVSPFLKHPTY